MDISRVTNSKTDLKLYGALSNGEVVNIFVDNVYRVLPVEGKIAIDIGANIADSAIYFAHRAAKRVIGIEPMPKNIEIAKKNIEINNLSDRISIVLATCSTGPGYVSIDSGLDGGIGTQIQDKKIKQGTTVPQVTLDYLLKENKTQREKTVLKMDCEGCEYEVILSASDDVLTCFSDILIEYHYGAKDLIKRLENCGFEVSLLNLSGKPGGATTVPNPERIGRWYYMGYLYARQKT
jgi:FkbM family methyltransferase